jgi:glycosyltransferase involved in cell wall biosynthesis
MCVGEPLILHHESKSRGLDDTPEKIALCQAEAIMARSRHPKIFRNDPFYNPNLSLTSFFEAAIPPRSHKPWRIAARSRPRVLMLSIAHQVGHGVAVVVDIQASHLASRGYEVFVAGPAAPREMPYDGCRRVVLDSPQEAACFAVESSIDCVIAHTPPFFSTVRWLGEYPRFIFYDYGEPNSEFFPDAEARRSVLVEKEFCRATADRVLAISQAVAKESGFKNCEVVPLGNTHLAVWDAELDTCRNEARKRHGWTDKFVVLNVCRFHRAEQRYKGIDTYVQVRDEVFARHPSLEDSIVFVLCGKAREQDITEIQATGMSVFPNVSDGELVQLYLAADLYANFSRWEGYNLGIGQALALGLPVLASDIPAHRAFPITRSNKVQEIVSRLVELAEEALVDRKAHQRQPVLYSWDGPLKQIEEIVAEQVALGSLGQVQLPPS